MVDVQDKLNPVLPSYGQLNENFCGKMTGPLERMMQFESSNFNPSTTKFMVMEYISI